MSQAIVKKVGPYSAGLGKTEANYASLSPLSFLPKAAEIYPNRIALIHGQPGLSAKSSLFSEEKPPLLRLELFGFRPERTPSN
jgi:hypothetical protein